MEHHFTVPLEDMVYLELQNEIYSVRLVNAVDVKFRQILQILQKSPNTGSTFSIQMFKDNILLCSLSRKRAFVSLAIAIYKL